MMEEEEVQEGMSNNLCINLLRAMELEDKVNEEEEQIAVGDGEEDQDQEMLTLSDEWVYAVSNEDKSNAQEEDKEEVKSEDQGTNQEVGQVEEE
jgi:hypothetical protein